ARSAGVEDFYKGKTVFLLIGYSVGGGYDAYARLLARHFGKHLPGNPNVVPQNMSGAGSLKAANYLYSVAPNDGSVIGTFSRTLRQVVRALAAQAEMRTPLSPRAGAPPGGGGPPPPPPRRAGKALRRAPDPTRHFWQRGRGLGSQHFRAALSQRVRRQDQDGERLSRHQRDPTRDRAGRGRRALRALMEHAQRPLPALAHGQQEGQHPGSSRHQDAAGAAGCSIGERARQASRPAANPEIDADRAGHGTAVRGPARHSRGSQGGADRGLRAHDQGPGLSRRGGTAQLRGQSRPRRQARCLAG